MLGCEWRVVGIFLGGVGGYLLSFASKGMRGCGLQVRVSVGVCVGVLGVCSLRRGKGGLVMLFLEVLCYGVPVNHALSSLSLRHVFMNNLCITGDASW